MVRSACRTALLLAAAGMLVTGALAARIEQPRDAEVVHSNDGDVTVVVSGIKPRQRVQPVLDGSVGDTAVPPTLQLHGVVRGDHTLFVKVLDENGSEIGRTAPVSFHVWHASRLAPPARRDHPR
jgi:hypothetical protein